MKKAWVAYARWCTPKRAFLIATPFIIGIVVEIILWVKIIYKI